MASAKLFFADNEFESSNPIANQFRLTRLKYEIQHKDQVDVCEDGSGDAPMRTGSAPKTSDSLNSLTVSISILVVTIKRDIYNRDGEGGQRSLFCK